MTNQLIPLAVEASKHIRITTAIQAKQYDLAQGAILTRMEDIVLGFQEGDEMLTEEIEHACRLVSEGFGPLMNQLMKEAALAVIYDN